MDIIIKHSVLFPTRSLRAENVATMILTFYVPNARTLFHRYWFSSDASRRLQRYFEIIEREIEFPERRAKAISLLRKKKKRSKREKEKARKERKTAAHGFGREAPRRFYRGRSRPRRRGNFQLLAYQRAAFSRVVSKLAPSRKATRVNSLRVEQRVAAHKKRKTGVARR